MPKAAKSISAASSMPDSLRQKIARSQVGTAPSLVPPGIGGQPPLPPAPPKESVAPKLDDVMEDSDDKEILRELVKTYTVINGQKKAADKQLKPITKRIKDTLSSYGLTQFICDGFPVHYFRTERRSINAGKLLAAGVTLETIEACTDVTASGTLRIGAESDE